ncbi:Ternary complex factor MIP1 [Senna tora]|uniref:Ternary complex factor MIP1 n=1 Tax=Senna tora TaxID=362788 RepID=A0A834WQX2_9FABA|nr:Ternary complex factor MIP1 [Senna tora]
MGEFYVLEKGKAEAGGYGESEDSPAWQNVQARHRRSKSASDRNMKISRGGILHPKVKDQNESIVSPTSVRTSRLQSPLHDNVTYINKNPLLNHRASLEKDVEQLQLRLQQEKSMRILLERAMGRASSTLSPGHRHFAAQTKDLISEIELLEEEVTSREQHVLSLYRNIFENCVSRPSSQQNSGMASPAHIKHESRKHPSIISSAFCSSKKFPLRPLQALTSINDSRNRIFGSNHGPLSSGKGNIYFKKTKSDSTKVHEKFSTMDKTPVLRTLKDHLHQCPSKLSEEMVRCMATVYCWLRSATTVNAENNRSPLLSRSSTNAIQPRHGIEEDRDWSCKSAIEISWISTHKRHSSHASYAINNYRVLVEQLERVNVSQMECDAQIAFWINVHNALVMHAYLAYGIPQGSLRRLALFHKAAYNIGGHIISANAIEQSIFCFRTPRIGRWLESIVSAALRKKSSEERQLISSKLRLTDSQPLVCFALCTGALSDPVLKVYTASNIREELDVAKRDFLQSNVVVKKSRKVFLPKLVERYCREATISMDDLPGWVMESVDKKLHDSIQKCLDRKSSKKASQIIEWLPYSSRFRYMFSKDLVEKPWWV